MSAIISGELLPPYDDMYHVIDLPGLVLRLLTFVLSFCGTDSVAILVLLRHNPVRVFDPLLVMKNYNRCGSGVYFWCDSNGSLSWEITNLDVEMALSYTCPVYSKAMVIKKERNCCVYRDH